MEAVEPNGPVKEEGDALLEEQPSPEPDGREPEPSLEPDGREPEPSLAPHDPVEPGVPVEPEAPADRAETTDAARAAEYLALAQRTQADFENFRKRSARDVRAAEARGIAKAARELLPALDHLALALDNLEPGAALDGVRLLQRELLAALARLGIESYSPQGEAFDPQVHEAVSQLPVEGVEAGTVFEVMQHGYRHGDAVLRPARVVVTG